MSRSFALLIVLAISPASVEAEPLRIYHIDVEQADATLFVAPGGKTLLVDSGKNGMGSRVKAAMDRAGVSKIDFFVCTHYHEDHFGGIDDLVALGVPVLESYDRGDKNFLPTSKRNEASFKDYQRAVGEDAIHITRGMTIPLDPAMTVTCISSGGVVVGETGPSTGVDENDMSVSLLVTDGPFRYFIGGDIEAPTEAKIAARDLVTDVNACEADHHGSDTSSSPDFMRDLSPEVIIISNGNNGTYKHPRKTTLDFYQTLPGPPAVFQTNKYLKGGTGGNVADAFIADPETSDDDGTILLTVDPAAGNYTVAYGAGTVRTFPLGPAGSGTVVLESLVPNPAGADEDQETVTVRNKGTVPVALSGWKLEDRSGLVWALTDPNPLGSGGSRVIRRDRRPMSLNNAGDEIRLLDAGGVVRDRFEFAGSSEGISISTNH